MDDRRGGGELRVRKVEQLGKPWAVRLVGKVAVTINHRVGGKDASGADRAFPIGKVAAVKVVLPELVGAQVGEVIVGLEHRVVDFCAGDPEPGHRVLVALGVVVQSVQNIGVGLHRLGGVEAGVGGAASPRLALTGRGIFRILHKHQHVDEACHQQNRGGDGQGSDELLHGRSSVSPVSGFSLPPEPRRSCPLETNPSWSMIPSLSSEPAMRWVGLTI